MLRDEAGTVSRCVHDWVKGPDLTCVTCVGELQSFALSCARRLTRSPHDAEDVAAEAVAEVLRKRAFDPSRASFPRYVRLVVDQRAKVHYRVEKRNERNLATVRPFVATRVVRDRMPLLIEERAAVSLLELELRLMIDEVVAHLSAANQLALRLHLAGYSRAEIAVLVPVDGRWISPQAWGQRLRPIQDKLVEALELRLTSSRRQAR